MSDSLGFDATVLVDPLIGEVLQDRYKVIRKLGGGGMGSVYEGEHLLIQRRVAIKTLHKKLARDADTVRRFHREALAATKIGNEHIIEVTDMGSLPDGAAFLVMEYLDGRTLSSVIEQDPPFTVARALHILRQLCEALEKAHATGIVHRDLKPDNIVLIRRGNDPDFVKILDFGVSKFRVPGSATFAEATREGTALGTPLYMPPEQLQGQKDLDHRADLYALGVILFEMLARVTPFTSPTLHLLVVKICADEPPKLRTVRPDVSAELEALVARMLAKKPADRPARCSDVLAALGPARANANANAVESAPAPTVPLPTREEPVELFSTANRALVQPGAGGVTTMRGAAIATDAQPAQPAASAPWKWALGGVVGTLLVLAAVFGVMGRLTPSSATSSPRGVETRAPAAAPSAPSPAALSPAALLPRDG